ncbi:MAG: glucose 1-dehydrogenase [Opitutaceae bacterium]|nr:glucose 1-dehydrogenase [Opitutaceae bacterium]
MTNGTSLPRLHDKVALITGAGQGIGREIALRFMKEGARVIVADLNEQRASAVAAEIAAAGGNALGLEIDVTRPAMISAVIAETLRRYSRLDVLVNNAGIGSNEPVLELSLEEWERNLRVNLTGTFLCAQAAARVMVKQGGGRIINIASISGQRGGVGRAAYGAAKAGVIQLTRVMAVELAPLGVGVNAISPGPIDTEQSRGTHTPDTRRAYLDRIPLKRYGRGAEIAAAAVFLASDDSSFVVGHILNVDGGFDAAGLIFNDKK